MATYVKVASVGDIPPGQGKCVNAGDREIALFNRDGKFYAVDNTCPHQGGPLAEGEVEGTVVSCPWHGWRFDIGTGVSPVNPAAKIATYPVKVEGNDILIAV